MIRFRCKSCGQKISVPEIHAGKKGKCPKCKSIVVVPGAETTSPTTTQSTSGDLKVSSKNSAYDLTLLDVPQKDKIPGQPISQEGVSDRAFEDMRELEERLETDKTEPVGKRKLPWIIDIFLYPISKPGLIILGLIIVVPLSIKLLSKILGYATLGFPPLLVLLALVTFVGFIIKTILLLYFYWYFCECIHESAAGELRAPETMGSTPGLGDMLWQLIRLLACLAFFFAPVLIYFQHNRTTNAIFWSLLGYAVFLFPMALLAVVMFDSLWGLNPILLIGSIFSTFFQYCGLILIFVFGAGVLILKAMPNTQGAPVLAFILRCVCIYLALVAAHLLGRFYWRYQEKLNWEV